MPTESRPEPLRESTRDEPMALSGGTESGHPIVVIGASTGGVEALMTLMAGLPAMLPAALFVVLHLPPETPSHLPEILCRAGHLRAKHPTDGEPIRLGRIYIAPPDRHLMIERGYIRLVRGPRENRHRPAIDPLFRSAALAYGPEVIGIVLTGALDDGTAGLHAIKEQGGLAIVQDPKDALVPSMPQNALEYVEVDYSVPMREMPALLSRLVRIGAPRAPVTAPSLQLIYETRAADLEEDLMDRDPPFGALSALTCPECGGPLWEAREGELLRYRCRVGHAFSGETMAAAQGEALDDALWTAYNTLRESMHLSRRLASEARGRGHEAVAKRFEERVHQKQRHADTILRVLSEGNETVPVPPAQSELHPRPAATMTDEPTAAADYLSAPTDESDESAPESDVAHIHN